VFFFYFLRETLHLTSITTNTSCLVLRVTLLSQSFHFFLLLARFHNKLEVVSFLLALRAFKR